MSPPKVSILLPAFSTAAATLDVSLRSVVRGERARWECIVVDDGSADATRAVAERIRGPRRRVISGPWPRPNRGLVAA